MTRPPRVSIVLPNYNYARYLDERIRSLLDQTFTDFELIIVDDASTDGSREVIGRYTADPRVRTQFHEQNSGHTYRRWNDGASAAQGEFLLFAGADDRCEPTLLATLVAVLDAHQACGLAHARSWMIDEAGRPIRLRPSGSRGDTSFIGRGADEAPFMLLKNTIPNASAALLRRSLFERCGGFDLSYRLSADHALWVQMLAHADLAYVAEPLNGWRTHDRTVRRLSGAHRFVLELYRVIAAVCETFAIAADVRERALQVAAEHWARAIVEAGVRPQLALDASIRRAAARVDPGIHRRLPRLLARTWLQRRSPTGDAA